MLRATSCVLTPSGEIAGHRANSATAEYETDSDEEEGSDSDDDPDYEHEEPVDESNFGHDSVRLPQSCISYDGYICYSIAHDQMDRVVIYRIACFTMNRFYIQG